MRYSIFEKITMIFIAICFIFVGLSAYFHFALDRGIEVEVDVMEETVTHREYKSVFDWLAGDVTEYTLSFEQAGMKSSRPTEDEVDKSFDQRPL